MLNSQSPRPTGAPHVALGRLLGPAANDGGDAGADAHDRAVLLVAEEAGAAAVGAEGLVGEPEFFPPNHARFHIGGELIVELFLADGHLGFVFGAEGDLQLRLADDGVDGLEEWSVVCSLHRLVARMARLVLGELRINQ